MEDEKPENLYYHEQDPPEIRTYFSQDFGELAKALAKAQSQMGTVVKGKSNPFFKSKYADLAQITEAVFAVLPQEGVATTQVVMEPKDGEQRVATVLMHPSNQWVASICSLKPVKTDPQGVGSCITYARRYSLAAVASVPVADDDGNAASGRKPVKDNGAVKGKALEALKRAKTAKDFEKWAEWVEGLPFSKEDKLELVEAHAKALAEWENADSK